MPAQPAVPRRPVLLGLSIHCVGFPSLPAVLLTPSEVLTSGGGLEPAGALGGLAAVAATAWVARLTFYLQVGCLSLGVVSRRSALLMSCVADVMCC